MRKFTILILFVLLLSAQIVAARDWLPQDAPQTASPQIIPHFAVFPGRGIDLTLAMSFNAGLAGIPDTGAGAQVSLYLYDGATGEALKSGSGADVCDPCVNTFSAGTRKITLSIEQLIEAGGGFSDTQLENGILGFGILVIDGDPDAVALQAVQRYMRASTRIPLTRHTSGPLMLAHFSETPDENTNTTIYATYVGGLAGLPEGESTIHLYLYDDTGAALQGNDGTEVCAPCTISLTSSARKQALELDDLIAGSGGFTISPMIGFGIIVVGGGGTNENLSIQVVQEFPFGISFLPLIIR